MDLSVVLCIVLILFVAQILFLDFIIKCYFEEMKHSYCEDMRDLYQELKKEFYKSKKTGVKRGKNI